MRGMRENDLEICGNLNLYSNGKYMWQGFVPCRQLFHDGAYL